ncbi:MAG TPA: glycosyltransferase, partial [Terriglobales bacterium]|nr:glycosyltransferase [Terriglobales bacterium]
MAAQADNPDGFWEHLGFVALNDELLSQLGGAWDLPPKPDEDFAHSRLDPLRMKARLLIERLTCSADCAGDTPATTESTHLWGWKDPRNSLTLPFWENLLPGMKTVIMVRNPLEVAHSMKERNGTSYSFGLRLWEIYNQRLIESASKQNRLVAHYDLFFENPETELRRITNFIGLSDTGVSTAAALIKKRRRHTHFSLDDLIDARVAPGVIELYRALIDEASQSASANSAKAQTEKLGNVADADFLSGSVSRLNTFVPSRIAQIENLYRELLAQAESRHKAQIEELTAHLAKTESRHKAQVDELTAHYSRQVDELTAHYSREVEQSRERILQMNDLLRERSVSLAENEARGEDLRNRLRQQLKATQKLSRLFDEVSQSADRLRSSARWQVANPLATLKAKLSPARSRQLLGYGHLEKILATYDKWRGLHPEIAAIEEQIQSLAHSEAVGSEHTVAPIEPTAPTRPIEFPIHEQVDVSIIIPVFNQFRFTHACLACLQENQGPEAFEVIVVDDCSTDSTGEAVPKMPGVVYLRNETNSGFVRSCNRGAEAARGKYLLFLNNDTLVRSGWLTALIDTFRENPRAGIAGSKLLYPDGRLQEAGGIIWRDASGWNYGKSDDPRKPEYNYLREVDYCSAAALMIPKSLFISVGGFDSRYEPAYYEDTDLAFKVREAGYKVLYQPVSEVIHYEGATGGTDLASGTKKHQEINRSTFAEKWGAELIKKPSDGDLDFLVRPPHGRKNILVIDHHVPMPDRDSGSLRMFQILKLLCQLGHRIVFIPDNLAYEPPYTCELQKRGIQVIYHPYVRSVRDYLLAHGAEFDLVVLSRCDFARKHISDVRLHAPQSRIIFDTVDLHYLREDGEARLTCDPELRRKAEDKQRLEYELIDQADETWVVSPVEQQLLRTKWPHKSVQLLSNIVDVPGSQTPFALRQDYLFIGGFQHRPNADAVLFFVRHIYPLVSRQLPDAKFYIIGGNPPPDIVALATDQIVVTGLQRDTRPFFESVRLSVAPLRFGAGVKGKINQSMACGVPVVATSIAIEGMELTSGQDILVADAPEDFARALIELYQSETLWKRLSENGINKTHELYSQETARKNLEFLFSDEHLGQLGRSVDVEQSDTALAAKS